VRLIRPSRDPLPRKHAPRERVSRVPVHIPEWLRKHIEDKAKFVLLSCGHRDNINDRSLTVIATMGRVSVWCERCNAFATVSRHMRFREYANLPPVEDSDIPLF